MELGPLGPAPAHSGLSFHDGMDVRLRGGIRRAGERGSWGFGDDGGDGAAGVASEADAFKIGRFGGAVRGGAGNRALKVSNAGKGLGNRVKDFVESAIGLETNPSKSS